MKDTSTSLFIGLILAGMTACVVPSFAQCDNQVIQLSGSVQMGCVNVVVTQGGTVGNLGTLCPLMAPYGYWLGGVLNGPITGNGSYKFVFSPPVDAASLNFTAFDSFGAFGNADEVSIEVNGAPYFITDLGVNDGCEPLPEITPGGTLIGCTNCLASGCKDLPIDGPISSLKVTNTHLAGATPSGTLFTLYICLDCCTTNAGVVTGAPILICADKTAMIQPATQNYLDADDHLQYILFSNTGDTLGSIVATSDTPQFSFNPATMQADVPYYIAAIAGDNLNGNVDLNDPCIDVSNAIQVTWRPLPTVTFTVPDDEVCQGTCKTIEANFTGTPPFLLKYKTGSSGITITQNFPAASGTFQVCLPPGTPLGDFQVQAVSVKDAFCLCE